MQAVLLPPRFSVLIKHKRTFSFSLLEVAIGLALTAILLTALFSSFRHLIQLDQRLYTTREIVHGYLVTRLRLEQLFETLTSSSSFYTLSPSQDTLQTLCFSLPSGLDPDPLFSTSLECTLSITSSHTLVLKRKTPSGEEKEELLTNWEKEATIEFYDPKELSWKSSWENSLPSPLVRLCIDGTPLYIFIRQLASLPA